MALAPLAHRLEVVPDSFQFTDREREKEIKTGTGGPISGVEFVFSMQVPFLAIKSR